MALVLGMIFLKFLDDSSRIWGFCLESYYGCKLGSLLRSILGRQPAQLAADILAVFGCLKVSRLFNYKKVVILGLKCSDFWTSNSFSLT